MYDQYSEDDSTTTEERRTTQRSTPPSSSTGMRKMQQPVPMVQRPIAIADEDKKEVPVPAEVAPNPMPFGKISSANEKESSQIERKEATQPQIPSDVPRMKRTDSKKENQQKTPKISPKLRSVAIQKQQVQSNQAEGGKSGNQTAAVSPVSNAIAELNHYSFRCHLYPRLSESNLQFHDLYWNKDANGAVTLRKRRVCVNHLIRAVRLVRLQQTELLEANQQVRYRAIFSLLDRRPFAKREIVSNIFAIKIPVVQGGVARVFRKTPASKSLLIRSNYSQREVALQIVVEKHTKSGGSGAPTNVAVLGSVELELLNERHQAALDNRTHAHNLEGGLWKLEFETADIPKREQFQTDCLPDVLICDERWVGILAIYRQLLCERLAEDGDVFAGERPTWLVDPVVGTFANLLDTDQNAVGLLLGLAQKYNVLNRELAPQEAVRRFRFVYMQFMMPLLSMTDSTEWRKQLKAFLAGETSEEPDPVKAFASGMCKMLDIGEYAITLCGDHAID